jgi:hypothetical protein
MGVELSRGCRHTRIKPHEDGLSLAALAALLINRRLPT